MSVIVTDAPEPTTEPEPVEPDPAEPNTEDEHPEPPAPPKRLSSPEDLTLDDPPPLEWDETAAEQIAMRVRANGDAGRTSMSMDDLETLRDLIEEAQHYPTGHPTRVQALQRAANLGKSLEAAAWEADAGPFEVVSAQYINRPDGSQVRIETASDGRERKHIFTKDEVEEAEAAAKPKEIKEIDEPEKVTVASFLEMNSAQQEEFRTKHRSFYDAMLREAGGEE